MNLHISYRESHMSIGSGPDTCIYTEKEAAPDLKEAQKFVGGEGSTVEMLRFLHKGKTAQMIVDEDGRAKDFEINKFATLFSGIEVRGPVIILLGKAHWR